MWGWLIPCAPLTAPIGKLGCDSQEKELAIGRLPQPSLLLGHYLLSWAMKWFRAACCTCSVPGCLLRGQVYIQKSCSLGIFGMLEETMEANLNTQLHTQTHTRNILHSDPEVDPGFPEEENACWANQYSSTKKGVFPFLNLIMNSSRILIAVYVYSINKLNHKDFSLTFPPYLCP